MAIVPLGDEKDLQINTLIASRLKDALSKQGRRIVDPALSFQPTAKVSSMIKKARARFKKGLAQYDGLDFKKSMGPFKDALSQYRKILRKQLRSTRTIGEEYVKTLFYLGAAALYEGDKKTAMQHFASAISYAPGERPSKSVFSPDVFKAYEEAKTGADDNGSLRIQCTPAAEVLVNGVRRGVSPITVDKLNPGRYLVRLQRAGYESDAQWIIVTEGSKAEVQTELKSVPQISIYQQGLADARKELQAPQPGASVARLQKLFRVRSMILVGKVRNRVLAIWAENGSWIKRHQGKVTAKYAKPYVERFLASRVAVALRKGECRSTSDCTGLQRCVDGLCKGKIATSTPIYKKWWFWTIIGAAVAGGTVGVVLGTRDTTEDWKAVLQPGGVQ